MSHKAIDKLGATIEPGDIIAYAVRGGNSGDMRIGKVLKVETGENDRWGRMVPSTHIIVRGCDKTYKDKVELNKANGTLPYPERIVVIPHWLVPAEYRTLLESVEVLP